MAWMPGEGKRARIFPYLSHLATLPPLASSVPAPATATSVGRGSRPVHLRRSVLLALVHLCAVHLRDLRLVQEVGRIETSPTRLPYLPPPLALLLIRLNFPPSHQRRF